MVYTDYVFSTLPLTVIFRVMVKLKDLREQTGRTQDAIASELGISRTYLSQLETEKRKPGRELAEKMGAYFHVSPIALLGYQMDDTQRELRDERDSIKDRLDLEKREHARELQAKQAEIDRLSAEVARLRHDLDFTQTVCRQMMKQNNLQGDTLSDGENM